MSGTVPIPDFQAFLAPLLHLVADGAEHTSAQLREKIGAFLKLTPEELEEKLPSGVQTVVANRMAWSLVYLTKARALERVKRGVFRINERGIELLRTYPEQITVQILQQSQSDAPGEDGKDEKLVASETPEEQLTLAYEALTSALATEVLEAVRGRRAWVALGGQLSCSRPEGCLLAAKVAE